MQLNFNVLEKVIFFTGDVAAAARLADIPALAPFDGRMLDFLHAVSGFLMKDPRAKAHPDVMTFGFWIRKGSLLKLKERFSREALCLGKGVVFHVAPSNVPVNFAYSLAAGLLCGNANAVRVPSKDFPQVRIITDAFNRALDAYEELKGYLICVRYGRDKEINDLFSLLADMRVVWGGDRTIAELRKSPLPPRSGEAAFADRYSLAVIDSDAYLSMEDKGRAAEDFYNDTFFSDQNACTSPRLVIWTGKHIAEAKETFWKMEHALVKKKYAFQPVQAVDKLAACCLAAAAQEGIKVEAREDNLIVRVSVSNVTETLMDYKCSGGYFFEYDCVDILSARALCNDKRCQTIAYIGDKNAVLPLIHSGVKGIDRVVPMGRTMDFDLIWDGYHLPSLLTRTIAVV